MKETKILTIRNKQVEIDVNCIPLIQLFNEIGLDTKICCEGHLPNENFNIMFEDYITDEKITSFLEKHSNIYDHSPFCGKFMKWCRKMSGNIVCNWMYIAEKKLYAYRDYKTISSK